MQMQTFTDPRDFLAAARPLLEADESTHNLILGVAARLAERPQWVKTPPYLAVVPGSTLPVLAAVMTPPHNLLLAGAAGVPATALDSAIASLREGGWSVPGVTAEVGLAGRFAEHWTEATGQPHRLKMSERVYELRQVIPPPRPPAGRLRAGGEADRGTLIAWHQAFTREALGEDEPKQSRETVDQRLTAGDVYVWEDGGQPVSMAMRTRPTPHGVSVGAVYTPPELRGRGYASALVAALSQALLDSGKQFCNLFTNLANPTSNSIYQKIGYRPVCDFAEYVFL